MSESRLKQSRVISIVAATAIALACGTNYAFSAWGPAYAERMVLSSTQQNLIGMFGNLGMYGTGIPSGMMVDRYGPRAGTTFGCVSIAIGYMAIYKAYVDGPGSMPLWLVCAFTLLTGAGGAAAFGGAIKTAAKNFPQNRGAATAFPLSGFGLSAFFFSTISSVALPGDTAGFLLFLSVGCFFLIACPSVFLRIYAQPDSYTAIPLEPKMNRASKELGMEDDPDSVALLEPPEMFSMSKLDSEGTKLAEDDDDVDAESGIEAKLAAHDSLYADVRGWKLLRYTEFYQQFFLLGCMTGIGLMTINNIGNDAQALWAFWAPDTTLELIRARQKMHVSLISLGSFFGRLLSGIGSDIVVRYRFSRLWCLVLSSTLFAGCQAYALIMGNPHFLFLLSGTTGVAYGFLFGCFPSIIAETFGADGLAQNWGTMTIAPILFGNAFNWIYGRIYDGNSQVLESGHRECTLGLQCYKNAYWVTFLASGVALAACLWSIRHGAQVKAKKRQEAFADEHIS